MKQVFLTVYDKKKNSAWWKQNDYENESLLM